MKKVKISSVSDDLIERKFSGKGATGETYVDRAFWQHRGFSSIPKDGDFGLVMKDGNFYVMVASSDKASDRPTIDPGDVCMHTSTGRYILLEDSGNITVTNDNAIITVTNSGEVNIKGNGNAGSIKLGSGSTGFKNLITEDILSGLNGHVHTGGTIAGNTGPPTVSMGGQTSEVQAK